jgi:uncharacterized tellurite resistance protein B-like protein
MLDGIKSFFNRKLELAEQEEGKGSTTPEHDPIQVAACALLLELAHADDQFTEDERLHIKEALGRHFDIDRPTVEELMQLAEEQRRRSVDLYQFTSLIAERYDLGQKMVLAEVMWGLVYADGELAKHESYLLRKVSNLLGIKPGYLSQARKKVVGEEG